MVLHKTGKNVTNVNIITFTWENIKLPLLIALWSKLMMQPAKTAFLKKEKRITLLKHKKFHWPWMSTKSSKKRNWAIAKSDEFTACWPSFPLIPTPMWAFWIIPTSFAPSPIANVTGSGTAHPQTNLTRCAFWARLTWQAITKSHVFATTKNISSNSWLPSELSSAAPSMIRAHGLF